MRKSILISLIALTAMMIGVVINGQTDTANWKTAETDPISAVGHGGIIDSKGQEIDPSPEFVLEVQQFYLRGLSQQAGEKLRTEFYAKQKRLLDTSETLTLKEQILINSALIAWLIEEVKPKDAAHLASKNGALRNRIFRNADKGTTISRDVLDRLNKDGLIQYISATTAGGARYIAECREAGVPIPPDWGDARWERVGPLRIKFIIRDEIATVYKYVSPAPDGVCLALPRSDGVREGDTITALGIICMGNDPRTNTSKACFWDNFDVTTTPRQVFPIAIGESVPLSRFAGGADLFGGNGVCSDCHAGNNPFIVHPTDAMDLGSALRPSGWYEPLVDPRWPQNPGPTTLLEGITLRIPPERSCLECHSSGRRIRFPEVSTELSQYCEVVLRDALGVGFDRRLPIPPATMPFGETDSAFFDRHKEALLTACSRPPVRTAIRIVINGATQSNPGSSRMEGRGGTGVCTGGDCPVGFCYWRTIHGPFWQTSPSSIRFDAPEYRGSLLRIYAEGGQWQYHWLSDPTGLAANAPPGGTMECRIFRDIAGAPDPNNCFSSFAAIVDPTGTTTSGSVDATTSGVTANVLSGFLGNVAQAAFGTDQQPDTLRISEASGRVLLSQRHTNSPPAPLRIGPLEGQSWTSGCNAWTPNYVARDVLSNSDVQLVPFPQSLDAFCFITGINGAWSSTRSGATQQPFAEIYTGPANDLRLRVSPSDLADRVGAYASCIKFR